MSYCFSSVKSLHLDQWIFVYSTIGKICNPTLSSTILCALLSLSSVSFPQDSLFKRDVDFHMTILPLVSIKIDFNAIMCVQNQRPSLHEIA